MQDNKSAIDKLLDQEFARQGPDPLHGVANVGLWALSGFDEQVSCLRRKLVRSVTVAAERGGRLLKMTGDLVDEGLERVGEAERYSNEKARLTLRLLKNRGKNPAFIGTKQ